MEAIDLPVIEDLAAHDMPAHTPAVLPTLVPQPVVTQHLGVEVMCLEGRVVDVGSSGPFKEEEAVMVHKVFSSVQSEKDGHVHTLLVVYQFAREEIEVCAVEFVALCVVGHAHAEVAKLMDGCRSLFEACKGVLGAVLLLGLVVWLVLAGQNGPAGTTTHKVVPELRKLGVQRLNLSLAIDQVERETIHGVIEGDTLAPARGILQLIDFRRPCLRRQNLGGLHKLLLRLHLKGSAAELVLVGLFYANNKGFLAIAAVVSLVADLRRQEETEIIHELLGFLEVDMLVVDVGNAHQLDLVHAGLGNIVDRHDGELRGQLLEMVQVWG